MNLALHGLSGDIRLGNSYYDDLHKSPGAFDFVMANPPFNVNGVDKDDEIAALALRFEKALRSPGVNYPGGSAPPRRVPDTGVTPPLPVPDMKTNKIRTTSVLAAIFLPILYGIMKLVGWAP